MKLVLYLHMHQPWRLARFRYLDLGSGRPYFDTARNLEIFRSIAEKSYRPTLARLARMLDEDPDFCLSLSITGTFVEQAQQAAPDVLVAIKRLLASQRVAVLGETYPHTLAFLLPAPELEEEIAMHAQMLQSTCGVKAQVLRLTELAYSDELALFAEQHGFRGILAEGWDLVLVGRTPNRVYKAAGTTGLPVLPRNYRLSDDIGFRYTDRGWSEYPLTARKYVNWISRSPGEVVGLFMDFETFGEHHLASTGIIDFIGELRRAGRRLAHLGWATVALGATMLDTRELFRSPDLLTWADQSRDLGAWLGNDLQRSAFEAAKKVGRLARVVADPAVMATWRRLLASDHFYYMFMGSQGADSRVHQHFSSYGSPFDAYANYMNSLTDLRQALDRHLKAPSAAAGEET